MFKWESSLVKTIDKNLPVLAALLIILFAGYMRRAGYYYDTFDLQSNFYPDLPTYLHTPFYTLLIQMLPALSITPVMQFKILVCLFDFIAAAGAVWLLKEIYGIKDKAALLACFTLLLISPLTIESGLLWLHLDSVCMSAFLWALALRRRRHSFAAGALFGIGIALLTQYAVLLPLLLFYEWRRAQAGFSNALSDGSGKHLPLNALSFSMTAMITAILLNAAAIASLGLAPQKGLFMLVNWLLVSPADGAVFSGLLQWKKAMPAYFGYMVGTLALITAFRKPKYRVPAAIVHLLLVLYIGFILQNGWN